jgi:hypothetical protein
MFYQHYKYSLLRKSSTLHCVHRQSRVVKGEFVCEPMVTHQLCLLTAVLWTDKDNDAIRHGTYVNTHPIPSHPIPSRSEVEHSLQQSVAYIKAASTSKLGPAVVILTGVLRVFHFPEVTSPFRKFPIHHSQPSFRGYYRHFS